MKELIPKDEYGIFADTHDTARVDSLFVAEFFEKEHKNVVRDIENLRSSLPSDRLLNFEETVVTRINPSGGLPILKVT